MSETPEPETVPPGEDNGPPADEVIDDYFLASAEVGDVQLVSLRQPVPPDWHILDGSDQNSAEWPEFAQAMRMRGPTFTLPQPERVPDGHRYIIKLGPHRDS